MDIVHRQTECTVIDCERCNTPVPPENDVTLFEFFRTGDRVQALAHPRHLLPVVVEGRQICPGTTSRAQYLDGQPRDPRYNYHAELEQPSRAAYATLLAQCSSEDYGVSA